MENIKIYQPETPPTFKYSFYWTVAITIFATFILTLLACYVLMVSIKVDPKPLVIQPQDSSEVAKLKQDLFEARVAYWQKENQLYVSDLKYDPVNRHKFYYAMWDVVPGTKQTFFEYDLAEDKDYDKFNEIDMNLGAKAISTLDVGDGYVRIEDILDSKLIFYVNIGDDSPGPCFEPFLSDYYKFQSLDLKTKKVEPFMPSKDIIEQKTKAGETCMSQLE